MQAFEVSEDMRFEWLHARCRATQGGLIQNNSDLRDALKDARASLDAARALNLKMLDQLGNQKPQPQVQPEEPKEKKKPKISLRNAMSRAEQVDD